MLRHVGVVFDLAVHGNEAVAASGARRRIKRLQFVEGDSTVDAGPTSITRA
jgi:hypothetical protein